MDAKTIPIVNGEMDRKKSIIENTPAIFEIHDNPNAVGTEPLVELDSQSEVSRWCGLIIQSAQKHGVDARLAMAIMYMETTHGWYDKFYPDFLEKRFPMRRSILPMNIHYRYWRKLGITKELVNCPYYNIDFGVILLSRIQARIKNPTIAKIASIYNFLGAEKVNNYGARDAIIYFEQPWVKKGCSK
jgi:hypothetical protein